MAGFTFLATNPLTGLHEYIHDDSSIEFCLLPGGSFFMGSPESEGGESDEQPVHPVTLSPFLLAKFEVTQAEYEAVMTTPAPHATLSATPSFNTGGGDLPVERVSLDDLDDADGFLARTGLSLPSEAQWEYACRAGQRSSGLFGPPSEFSGNGNLDDMGWYLGNSGNASQVVGQKLFNQFGLYDMHGNVFEWCEDVYDGDFYSSIDAAGPDPLSTAGSSGRVIRGGSFLGTAGGCRSANRLSISPSLAAFGIGFRPARPLP